MDRAARYEDELALELAVDAQRIVGAIAGIGIVQGDGKIPYTAEALATRDENRKLAVELDPEVKCYLPGIPRANYMDKPFQIFHSDKAVFFAYEYAGAVRNVFLEDPGEAPLDSWMGQSYGKWEGDTFVVEVTGLLQDTWLDRSGNHHGYADGQQLSGCCGNVRHHREPHALAGALPLAARR